MNKRYFVAVLLALPALPSTAGDLTLSSGLDFSSGKYGASQSTEIWYVPLTARYETGAATFKLSVPYVRIRAPTGGKLIGVDAQGRPIYDGTGAKSSEEGMGDVVASVSYSLFEQPIKGLLLDLTAKAKLGTADVAKGLGTGENDYTALADLYYLAGAWTPFATVSYRLTGDPAGSDLKNVWGGTLGLGYKRSATDSLGLMWDSRQASTTTGVASNEATAYWVHKFSGGMKLQTYAVKGFSDGSADWGLGAMLSKSIDAP
ncbi:MAG: hypothetical protein Q8M09_13600 [Pseudomonadota bacterium]|nr:hypothetical protein [Pseudomonadota bacterium]MDP1905262.1 hypothetical protein [Pseudomonadota bacterium]MDP2352548.1 hypothetical protein [Pseudomonadota bacterium]